MTMRHLLAAAAVAVALPAHASDMLTGEEIRAAVSGNTVEGRMFESGDYAEFYAEDGTIRGDGYTGAWSVEGDTMCFRYGEDPADCWSVGTGEEGVEWIRDGAVEGVGTVREGNPNDF